MIKNILKKTAIFGIMFAFIFISASMIVSAENSTDTDIIIVKEKPVTIRIDHGSISFTVKNENKNVTKVSIIDALSAAEAILSDDEMKNVMAGTKTQIVLRVVPLYESGVSKTDLAYIEDAISELRTDMPQLKKRNFVDISIKIKTGHDDWKEIYELNSPIKLMMGIPSYYEDIGDNYYVLSISDGKVKMHEDLDMKPNKITFETNSLSTHTLVFNAEEQETSSKVIDEEESKLSLSFLSDDSVGWFLAATVLIVALIRDRVKAVNRKNTKKR